MPTQTNYTKIKRLNVFDGEKDLQKFLEVNFTESLKQMIKVIVKTMVKQEMESFRKQFEEKIYFNGSYGRNMLSSFGRIENIPIPRFRSSTAGMDLKTLGVFDQEKGKFMQVIQQMHLLGISQRKIRYLAQSCFGINLSANRVGVIYRELAEKEEVNINNQVLDDNFEYLLLDGIWEKTKGYGWDDNKSVLLCALGIRPDGKRKIIGFSLARSEDTTAWRKLLGNLKKRGLNGKSLRLAITDDNGAIKKALGLFFPGLPVQNCIVHKMRNVLKRTKHKNKPAIGEDLKTIFASRTKKEAMDKAKAVVKKWYMSEPKAMEALRFNIEYCFTYLAFPKILWTKLRTTNLLEREFRELRRRMKVFDNTFQNDESAQRYANTIVNYLNQNYPFSKGGLHTNA